MLLAHEATGLLDQQQQHRHCPLAQRHEVAALQEDPGSRIETERAEHVTCGIRSLDRFLC